MNKTIALCIALAALTASYQAQAQSQPFNAAVEFSKGFGALQHSSNPNAKSYSNATLNGVSFSGQSLQGVQFLNTEANQTQFQRSDLSGGAFNNTELNGADFRGAIIRNVTFSNVELTGADFTGAVFENVTFLNVDISGARIQRNQISQINMANTTMDNIVWVEATSQIIQPPAQAAPRQMVKAEQLSKALAEPGKKIDLTVNFEFDSDKILAEGHAQIDEIARALKSPALAGAQIRVEGHTDDKGSDAYNKDLSYRRSVSVRRALTEKYSINGDQLSVEGFGESQPVASNSDEQGRSLNRRVTLVNISKR